DQRGTDPDGGVRAALRGSERASILRHLPVDPLDPPGLSAWSVGFGQTISVVRGRDWQVAVAAGVFSEFNMRSSTTDLVNIDYLVGLPITYRRGPFATRFRVFHESSHLGDEYL